MKKQMHYQWTNQPTDQPTNRPTGPTGQPSDLQGRVPVNRKFFLAMTEVLRHFPRSWGCLCPTQFITSSLFSTGIGRIFAQNNSIRSIHKSKISRYQPILPHKNNGLIEISKSFSSYFRAPTYEFFIFCPENLPLLQNNPFGLDISKTEWKFENLLNDSNCITISYKLLPQMMLGIKPFGLQVGGCLRF